MAKAIIYSDRKGILRGVYSNKKNLWDILEQEEDVDSLSIKLNPTKITKLGYSKVVKYLKERSMLRIYKNNDLEDYDIDNDIESCPTYIKLWEVEINKPYKLEE